MSSSSKTGSKGHSSYIAVVLAVSILVFAISGFAANISTSSGSAGQGATVTAGYSMSKVTYGGAWSLPGANNSNTNVTSFAFILRTAADGVGVSTVTNTNTVVWAQLTTSGTNGNWVECVVTGSPVAGNTVCVANGLQQKPLAQVTGVNVIARDRNSDPVPSLVQDALILSLDAANPASYPGSGTTWTDLTGNGNNGTLVNGVSYSSEAGGALVVDGVDDFILAGRVPGTGTATASVSWSMWVSPTSTAGNIMSMSVSNPQNGWNMPPISAVGQRFTGKMWDNTRLTSSVFTPGSWYHVAFVWKYSSVASERGQFLYVNGELQGSQTGVNYIASGSDNFLFFGLANPGHDNSGMFSRKYGSIQVYNKALTTEEVQQNFYTTKSRFGL